jgi:pimeloyl-ACP methyl ester carboxylesterase
MRRRITAPLVFAAAAALALHPDSPGARGQDKPAPPAEETVLTADGVQLRGLFHRSPKGDSNSPVVILLYQPGLDRKMTTGDWEGLANRLNGEGFHVFRFDWRGHGKSTDIRDPAKFAANPFTGPWNVKFVAGAGRKPLKNTLQVKDLRLPNYYPAFATDLAAVRVHLDQKNDNGELNTSSVYLIGAGEAATLGLLWIAAEWNRPATYPGPNQLSGLPKYDYVFQPLFGGVGAEAGETIAGAVWLSPGRPTTIPERAVQLWASKLAPKMRDNNPMLFLYGDKDGKGKQGSEFFHDAVLVAKGNPQLGLQKLTQTFIKPIEKTALTGVNLLGNNATLKTEDTIMQFLAAIQKDRAKTTRKQRGFSEPYYIRLTDFGLTP